MGRPDSKIFMHSHEKRPQPSHAKRGGWQFVDDRRPAKVEVAAGDLAAISLC
ncbi:MAG: hypothetical protein WBA66_15295 [Xanthobacteraceae bacterium]